MRRSGWPLVIVALLALVAAGAFAYRYFQPAGPLMPAERVERKTEAEPERAAGAADPAADLATMPPSAQNEIDCVDRLLSRPAAADVDQKAEWDRCRALGEAAVADEARREQDAARAGNGAGDRAPPRP